MVTTARLLWTQLWFRRCIYGNLEIQRINRNTSGIEVPDDHMLTSDELKVLPAGFLTPAKLVNGVLTSATQTESDDAVEEYRKNNDITTTPQPTSTQQSITMLSKQIADTNQTLQTYQTTVESQSKMIAQLTSEVATLKQALDKPETSTATTEGADKQ